MFDTKIICDSSCDLSLQEANDIGVSVVPLTVTFGDKTFRDRYEISPEEFYKLLDSEKDIPKTSQPSPNDYAEEFRKYASYKNIICLCLTSKSSGSYNSAVIARDLLKEENFEPNIYIIDTLNVSGAYSMLISFASRLSKVGETAASIVQKVEEKIPYASLYFVLDTLEYVRIGGRIGNVKAGVGKLLNIKPILTFLNGTPTDVGKCRGTKGINKTLVDMFMKKASDSKDVIIIHSNAMDKAKALANDIREQVGDIYIKIQDVGSVVGTYAGPGGIGLAFFESEKRW